MSNILYKLVKFTNEKNEAAFGKYYAHAVATETLSFDEFIEHIISHGSVYDRGTVQGIMYQMLDCLVELLLDSKKIRFGDLGTFYLSLKSEGVEDEKNFSVGENINGLRLRFMANRSQKVALDSKSLRKKASFKSVKELTENPAETSDSGGTENP